MMCRIIEFLKLSVNFVICTKDRSAYGIRVRPLFTNMGPNVTASHTQQDQPSLKTDISYAIYIVEICTFSFLLLTGLVSF